jgi:hypothetical protein
MLVERKKGIIKLLKNYENEITKNKFHAYFGKKWKREKK